MNCSFGVSPIPTNPGNIVAPYTAPVTAAAAHAARRSSRRAVRGTEFAAVVSDASQTATLRVVGFTLVVSPEFNSGRRTRSDGFRYPGLGKHSAIASGILLVL